MADAEQVPGPLDGINPAEVMGVLFNPIADLICAVQESGEKLTAMLLRHEFQRGYAAGWHAAMVEAHAPDRPAATAATALRDRITGENIRLTRPTA